MGPPPSGAVVVRVLGSPVIEGTSIVSVRGGRQLGILALLCAKVGERVATARLEDELWEGRPVSDAALRVTLNRIRSRFLQAGLDDPVVSEHGGYRLDLDPWLIDLSRFGLLVDRSRSAHLGGRSDRVLALTGEALSLWRGPAFEDLPDLPTAVAAAERVARLRIDALGYRAAAQLAEGEAEAALATLGGVGEDGRFREDIAGLCMLSAIAVGRRDLALEHHRRVAGDLDREIGVAPGRQLEELRSAIEVEDDARIEQAAVPFLAPVSPAPAIPDLAAAPHDATAPFVGRVDELDRLESSMAAGSVSVVRGPSGVGKSSLATELGRRLAGRGMPVVSVSCSRVEAGSEPILRALAEADIDASALAAELQSSVVVADWDLRRFRVHQSASDVLAAAGRAAVVCDDLHWLDPSGAQLLLQLVRATPQASWVLITRTGTMTSAARELLDDLRDLERPGADIDLGPMDEPDVALLVRAHGGELDDAAVASIARRSGGMPIFATALANHALSGGPPDDPPASLQRSMASLLADSGADVRACVELIAVADAPVPVAGLVAVRASPDAEREGVECDLVERIVGTGLVAEGVDGLELAHDLVGAAVVANLTPDVVVRLRVDAAEALGFSKSPNRVVICRHLLAAGVEGSPALEAAIAPALAQLTAAAAYDEAAVLAQRFLEVAGPYPASTDGLLGRMQVAAVLLGVGQTDAGLALHEAVLPLARRLNDPVVLANAVLARGPLDLGASEQDDRVGEALGLLRRLPSSALTEKAQLSCWAAHHGMISGAPVDVEALLDEAEAAAMEIGDSDLRGLALGLRYQASASCSGTPRDASVALDRLKRWTEMSRTLSSETIVRLFELDHVARVGTLDEHRAATDRLAEISRRYPRPDVVWYVEAARAAALLAEGDLDNAAGAVAAAAQLGAERHVVMAGELEMLHQALILSARGLLAVIVPMLQRELDPDGSVLDLALAGYVAQSTGDRGQVAHAASLLAARPDLLVSSGVGWPLVAHMSAEVAHASGDAALGRLLHDRLAHRAGTGLTVFGLAMLGATDRLLGLALSATGDRVGAKAALERARDDDSAKGMTPWADLAGRLLDEV